MLSIAASLALCLGAALGQAPTLAARSPAHEAMDVDPGGTELTLTFDRDMDTGAGWSICGGGPTFPVIESVTWRDARTLALQVRLTAGMRYEMPLNCETSSQRFRDARGVRLAPTPWSFSTSAGAPADEAQRARNEASLTSLRERIERDYSYRDRVVADWDEAFSRLRAPILEAGSDAIFAQRIVPLLGLARDPHVWVGPREALVVTFDERPAPNYELGLLERRIPDLVKENDTLWHGQLEDGERTVGYLLVRSLSVPGDLAIAQDVLDELASNCDGLVLDLRPNGGGNELLALPIAAWFVEGSRVYARQAQRDPATGRWDSASERRILGHGDGRRFRGPVAVLIGPRCLSSGEAFVLMMRQAERAVLVGARTGGSSGNPQPHRLPNGTTVWLPSWRATDAQGQPFEGLGLAPDVEVPTTPEELRERDPVLEAALEVLRRH